MTIRRATPDDIEGLRALYDEFHAFHVRGVPDYLRVPNPGEVAREEFDRAVERLVHGDEATLLIAESFTGLVGFAEVYLDPQNDSPFVIARRTATLQSLLVAETLRGTGLGRALVAAAEQWAVERGSRGDEGEDVGVPRRAARLL